MLLLIADSLFVVLQLRLGDLCLVLALLLQYLSLKIRNLEKNLSGELRLLEISPQEDNLHDLRTSCHINTGFFFKTRVRLFLVHCRFYLGRLRHDMRYVSFNNLK